jgi:hypothetical protein
VEEGRTEGGTYTHTPTSYTCEILPGKNRRTKGRKDIRTKRRKDGRTENGRTEERKKGRTVGREERKEGKKEGSVRGGRGREKEEEVRGEEQKNERVGY